jgi:xylulokinase
MPQKHFILAHDLGTTGNKATLFDTDGSVVISTFASYGTDYSQPNWAEQNPDTRARYEALYGLFKQSYIALEPIHEQLAKLLE